ncbi:MAG: phosphoglycerate mutase family protein [Gammaproteobacteria bacterium]|nr:phosphoglycerate mutase family protein [Gammaproteobacteria bacterium]
MTSIYLIRHGQASFGKENYDELSALGEKQAIHLGRSLAQRLPFFDSVFMGSMKRHKQTALGCLEQFENSIGLRDSLDIDIGWNEYDHAEILRVLRPEFETAASMMEFVKKQENPKAFFELSFNQAIEKWMSGEHDQQYSETWREFKVRVHGALERVIEASQGQRHIAVFTSGGPISLLSQSLLGVDERKLMRMNWTLMNCGVTKIIKTRTRSFLSSLNEHTHFEGEDEKHLITYS